MNPGSLGPMRLSTKRGFALFPVNSGYQDKQGCLRTGEAGGASSPVPLGLATVQLTALLLSDLGYLAKKGKWSWEGNTERIMQPRMEHVDSDRGWPGHCSIKCFPIWKKKLGS